MNRVIYITIFAGTRPSATTRALLLTMDSDRKISPEDRGRIITVPQGGYRVSSHPNEILSAILGSCVATCMWDPVAEIGGLNHFMLADSASLDADNSRYGLSSMKYLIQALIDLGADRRNLEAKLFGGSQMSDGLESIGCDNIRFARQFLITQRIPCTSESLGGHHARKLQFRPTTGQVKQMMLITASDIDTGAGIDPLRIN